MNVYCRCDFSATEITQIRQIMADHPECHRAELSRKVCRMLQWYKADVGLKEMSCRMAMLRMHANGLIHLPPPKRAKAALRAIIFTPATNAQNSIMQPVHHLEPLLLRKVERPESSLWNEYIERYYYVGYTPLPGAQMRYFVMLDQQVIALLGFGAAAWQAAPRDSRGKLGPSGKQSVPIKDLWLYPLDTNFRKILTT